VSKFVIQAGDLELPLTPYAGTSGWSGSETSKERAKQADKDGTTYKRQKITLDYIKYYENYGVTWKELSDLTGWHHGSASGVLSVLHKEGYIVRLKDRRNKCAIYVHPVYLQEREVVERKVKTCKNCGCEQ
jgi:DNA-binding MarR family transcriptional regulator